MPLIKPLAAVMVEVPTATPVTNPVDEFMEATPASEEFQVKAGWLINGMLF